ncbi:hypothetical protein NHG68_19605 [Enterobacter sp. Z1]|uniref:hypothetical protein n=1 Tax=Enterobacter sp. Z1 TaxID=2561927 RepID=UPI0011DFDF77|nr:hypothetical protein [Enterobacter sp. Z1]TYD01638.1 hypothetical protein E4M14_021810 [Enterobacter sp. Z1]USX31080.1 hypothetical protein NHG68_19605 [Enterobacter sp. Z1]
MNNIDKHGLLGVPKHANQHRLSRLTMEVHTDELRIMASAVESYTDELIAALEAAEKRIAELEAREKSLRTVGVMSQKAFQRLEGRESRFIALWPRPEIYLPRKRPDDGVIVYARVAGAGKGEAS